MTVVHSGFDGLKFTIQTDISPELRTNLLAAKEDAAKTGSDCIVELGGLSFAVRRTGGMAFSVHTGEYGAEWFFLDPENRAPNMPGVTVDFRAFLLASQGLRGAQEHFEHHAAALGLVIEKGSLRVSRVDFAVDVLAPWFEPSRDALVVPPGTRIAEHTGVDETVTNATGSRVTGLRAGAIANRQLVIYDKRAEVIAKGKMGWLRIWNASLAQMGHPAIDLSDPDKSQIWRFEMRMGSKQLRNRWSMLSWEDLNEKVGNAYAEFCQRMRYSEPTSDQNRSRWPAHPIWSAVAARVSTYMCDLTSNATPIEVKEANREEHQLMLDKMITGLLFAKAAASGLGDRQLENFCVGYVSRLIREAVRHPVPPAQRLANAAAKYRFR